MQNYWKLRSYSLFTAAYAYIDHSKYLADDLFRQYNIRVKFGNEFAKDGMPYQIIICKIPKKDISKFEGVMEKLINKMLLLGYDDYENVCDELCKILEKK